MASNDEEFNHQLELEAREKRLRDNAVSNDPYTHVDPVDGTIYEWDHEKHAWFPKIDENFIAAYQSHYGYNGNDDSSNRAETNSGASAKAEDDEQSSTLKQRGEKRPAEDPPGWFEVADEHNTNVYVSNLPYDITEDEFTELMSKCGLIMKDPSTNKLKIKLYRDREGHLKGDGLCCYIKVESVDLALKIIDGYQLRDKVIRTERAKFQMKGQYDPAKKPRKLKSKDKKKIKEQQEKLLDWRPDKLRGMRMKCEKTVIIKNMFNPEDFKKEPELILEYQNDLREECSKFGQVKKVKLYDRHAEGVASVTFKEPEEADVCIQVLHGRWFGGRQLSVETWDGKTRYHINESVDEEVERLQEWEKYITKEEDNKNTE